MTPTEPASMGLNRNLERSAARRATFEKQLSDLNLHSRYSRFPAVDGHSIDTSRSPLKPGEMGLFLSHCRALESARNQGLCVHVLEDDTLLSEHVVPVLNDGVAGGLFQHYDLIFTDMMIHCHVPFLKSVKSEFDKVASLPSPLRLHQLRLIDLSQVFYAASQSYIVGARSIDKVIAAYTEELAKGPTTPVDMFLQQQVLEGKLRAACLFPFITSVRLEEVVNSTIPGKAGSRTIMVMAVLRYLFFLGCDLNYAKRILDDATGFDREKIDLRRTLIAKAMEFAISDDFGES